MDVDLSTRVGSVRLPSPVMTASGTSGHGVELSPYGRLSELGAVVVKSLTAGAWPGNPAPRLAHAGGGMINSVGLQGPGMSRWLEEDLPALMAARARVVVSIWGRTVDEFAETARLLRDGLRDVGREGSGNGGSATSASTGVVAVEVNVSCPNIEDRSRMFAHSPSSTAAAVSAAACGLPRWAKLSPNVTDIREIAASAMEAGADGLTLVNTLLGLSLDVERRRPALGAGGGGVSGPPLRPIALRSVWECRKALPTAPIVGVGGIERGVDAAEMLMAGADAVQVGTATFRDPRSPWRVGRQLARWCASHGVRSVSELRGAALAESEGGPWASRRI